MERTARDLRCGTIWCTHFVGNEQSHRVMETCGLTYVRTDRYTTVPLPSTRRDKVVMRRMFSDIS